jgi:hypothetical protein
MDDLLIQFWKEIVDRPGGPFAMRFYLQPTMAAFFAVRDGLKDARAGKPPYFWELFINRAYRRELMQDGWKSIRKVFIMASILDIVYQLVVLRAIRPLETLVVASMLAIFPYLLLRGPINRIARNVWKDIDRETRRRRRRA